MKLAVNLATRPMRNRRFFRLAIVGLVGLALLTGWAGLGSLVHLKKAQSEATAETARLEATRAREEALRGKRESETALMKSKLKEWVEVANQALTLKGFSWVEFFSLLEEALPSSSYISSMAPVTSVDGRLEVRFKVVSPGWGDTLQLVQRLTKAVGRPPLVQSEMRTGGQTVSEMTLSYERIH